MKEKNVKAKAPNKKVLGLTTKIFIALLAGAILGIVLCYLVPDSSFKKDVIVEGILYVIGQGFIRLMKMLVVPLGILLFSLRKYGDRRYQEARNRRCENSGILPCNNCTGSLRCTWCRKSDQSWCRT